MKVTVSREALAHGLSVVSRAVSARSTLPVLSNVLVATDEGRMRLSATNLELAITCWIPAEKIEEEGAITVPARTFGDLVSTFPNEPVTMALDETTYTLHVRCGASHTDIKGIDAEEFPPLPVPDFTDGVRLPMKEFKEMVQQVAFAASSDDARPVLTGVLLRVRGNHLTLAASDGYRLAVREAELPEPAGDVEIIVPARALTELARIVDPEATLRLVAPPERGQVIFRAGDVELIAQLIEGQYPAFEQIIPHNYRTRTVVSTSAFLKACKQAEIFARESANIVRLDITPGGEGPGEMKVSAHSEETGSSETTLTVSVEGAPIIIAFNVRFLREALDAIPTPEVALETTAPASPSVIRPVGEDRYIQVIMPMHLP